MSDPAKAAEQAAAGTTEQQTEKTFTQSEVEALIKGRLAKFSDYEDIKKELTDIKAASQTEQERAVEVARKEARAEALAEVNKRLIAAETRAVAASMGFLYPEDAHLYVSTDDVAMKDDGSVDGDSVKAALKKVAKDRPALVKSDKDEVPPAENAGIGVHAPAKPKTVSEAWASDVSGKR